VISAAAMSSDVKDRDTTSYTRPYTYGVSIAAVLIFLIAIFHVWKLIFKQIKKLNETNQLETVVTEIPTIRQDRKLSASCIHQLEMVLHYDDKVNGIQLQHTQNRSRNSRKSERKSSRRNSGVSEKFQRFSSEKIESEKITFFAGYSHRHINDA
jgi:hypothetical protein